MIRPGFLDSESRQDLIELARDGSAAHRLARRANALVLLDDGMSCEAIAKVLLLDDDTIRTWHRLYEEDGIEGLASFGYEGSACRLSDEQQDKLKAWIAETLPRTTREVGAWIEKECGIEYQGRSGLIALLARRNSQIFSTGFNSGEYGGSGNNTMFSGTLSRGELCQPAPSSTSRATAPTETRRLISARCSFMASTFTSGMTIAAPVLRSGQTAPNK